MVDDQLVAQLRSAYEAWIGGDPGPADEMIADDVTWELPGNSKISGTYNSLDEVHGLWQKLAEHLRGLELHEFYLGEDSILVLNTVTLTAGSAYQAELWRFNDDRKAIEFTAIADTALFESAFGSK